MRGTLNEYLTDTDKAQSEFPYVGLATEFALLRAMAAGIKELEMSPDEFITCMRYAINANLYKQETQTKLIGENLVEDSYPTILAMKIVIK